MASASSLPPPPLPQCTVGIHALSYFLARPQPPAAPRPHSHPSISSCRSSWSSDRSARHKQRGPTGPHAPATRAPSHSRGCPPLPARTAGSERAPTPAPGAPRRLPHPRGRTGEEGAPPREALPEPGRGRGGGRRREAGRGRGVLPTRHLAAAPAGRRAASSPRRGGERAAGPEEGGGRARRGPGPGPGDGVSRVPGRGAQGAGGRRKAGGGVWAGHAAPASARQSRARTRHGRAALPAPRTDSRPGRPALPAGGETGDREGTAARLGSLTWRAVSAPDLPAAQPRRAVAAGGARDCEWSLVLGSGGEWGGHSERRVCMRWSHRKNPHDGFHRVTRQEEAGFHEVSRSV